MPGRDQRRWPAERRVPPLVHRVADNTRTTPESDPSLVVDERFTPIYHRFASLSHRAKRTPERAGPKAEALSLPRPRNSVHGKKQRGALFHVRLITGGSARGRDSVPCTMPLVGPRLAGGMARGGGRFPERASTTGDVCRPRGGPVPAQEALPPASCRRGPSTCPWKAAYRSSTR